jgi:hypothetical protein
MVLRHEMSKSTVYVVAKLLQLQLYKTTIQRTDCEVGIRV